MPNKFNKKWGEKPDAKSHIVCDSRTGNSQRQKVNQWWPGVGKREEQGLTGDGKGASLQDDDHILDLDSGDGYVPL